MAYMEYTGFIEELAYAEYFGLNDKMVQNACHSPWRDTPIFCIPGTAYLMQHTGTQYWCLVCVLPIRYF